MQHRINVVGGTNRWRVLVDFVQRGIEVNSPILANKMAREIAQFESIQHVTLANEQVTK